MMIRPSIIFLFREGFIATPLGRPAACKILYLHRIPSATLVSTTTKLLRPERRIRGHRGDKIELLSLFPFNRLPPARNPVMAQGLVVTCAIYRSAMPIQESGESLIFCFAAKILVRAMMNCDHSFK
jgi:hypothetical protein